jgi:hypothetical protein
MANAKTVDPPQCPSAQPGMPGAVVFGLVQGTATEPRAAYLGQAMPLTSEILANAAPVEPTEIYRIAAACAGDCCQHFCEGRCSLVTRIVQLVPPVVTRAPACALRPSCMWWRQQGVHACLRCPQIVTRMHGPSAQLAEAAAPPPACSPCEGT